MRTMKEMMRLTSGINDKYYLKHGQFKPGTILNLNGVVYKYIKYMRKIHILREQGKTREVISCQTGYKSTAPVDIYLTSEQLKVALQE